MHAPSLRLAVVAALVLVGAAGAARAEAPDRVVYLQPLGAALPEADVALVSEALRAFYAVEVRVLPRRPLPRRAWYPPRRRWRAEILLEELAAAAPPDAMRVLGLTAADISTTKGAVRDWGVLGLGSLDGLTGVISTFRCHKGARDALHARQRLAKTAVHELGHTLGLDHCPRRGCLMQDAEGKVATTDGEYDLCADCRRRLEAAGRGIPPAPSISWPHP